MTEKRHVPLRTCIGCRKKREKEEMIWLVQSGEGVIRVDRRKPHRGRGFYLCPNLQCLKMAKGRKKAIESLGTMDFQSFLTKDFSKNDRVSDVGGRNDKE